MHRWMTAAAIGIASLAALHAQQSGGAASPKPLTAVAANSLVANPDAYYGQPVSITAAVDQILSRTAFSIEQTAVKDAGNGSKDVAGNVPDVLVLAPNLHDPVDLNAYVTVMGEVVRFDPTEVARKAKNYTLDLAPDVVEKYRGRPAVLATAVVNAKMVDLAKRIPPPMTAEEKTYSEMMKKVGPAFAALRTGIDGSKADGVAPNVAVLKQAFTDTEAFWKGKGKADAVGWAQDARKQVESIELAAAGSNWDAMKASAGTLGQACQTCHTAYRERFDDGSYRIKTGG